MPKMLTTSAKEIVLKVHAFCEKEKANKGYLIPVLKVRSRVAAITGISEKTVSRISKEGDASSSSKNLPEKRRRRKKKVELDDLFICAVKNKINEMYNIRKEVPTLSKLLVALRNDIDFKGSRTTLWKMLRQMGLRFANKSGSNSKSKRKPSTDKNDPAKKKAVSNNVVQDTDNIDKLIEQAILSITPHILDPNT